MQRPTAARLACRVATTGDKYPRGMFKLCDAASFRGKPADCQGVASDAAFLVSALPDTRLARETPNHMATGEATRTEE